MGVRRRGTVAGRAGIAAAVTLGLLADVAGAAARPVVRYVDVVAGPVVGGPRGLGTPITISGLGFGATRGRSRVTIGGVPVARYLQWGARSPDGRRQTIIVQPGRAIRGGHVVVTVAGRASRPGPTFSAVSGAHVFVVAMNGADGRTCRVSAPCATVGWVIRERTRPGDVVLMRAGTYTEDELWIRGDMGDSGTDARPRTVAAWPTARVDLVTATRPWIVDADHITIAGLRFLNGKPVVIPDGATRHRGNRFVGNTFRGTIGYAALAIHGDNVLVAGNDCRVTGSSVGTEGHCFYVSEGRGIRLRDNTAAGAPGYGLHVFDQQRAAGERRRVISDVVIEGNQLVGSRERSGLILSMGDEGGVGNVIERVLVRGNTLRANNHSGMVIGANVRTVTIRANAFRQNGRQGLIVADEPSIVGVTVTANSFLQSVNGVCTQWCSWYQLAHLSVGARASVTVRGNAYGPGAPRLIGARDPSARHVGS